MKASMKWGAILAAAVLASGSLAGCSRLETKTDSETVFATYGKEEIMLDEVKFQLNQVQYSYESLFSAYYGTTDFWDQDYGNGATMEQNVINNTIVGIHQTKVLNDYAKKNNIALTEEQQKLVDDSVAKALEADEEYKSAIGMTEDLVKDLYTENAIANAVYLKLVEDVDTSVGEDEFIRKDISYVRVSPSDLAALTEAAEEESVSEADKEEASEEAPAEQETETGETAEAETGTAAETEKKTEAAAAEGASEQASEAETELSEEEKAQKDAIAEAVSAIRERFDAGESAADFISEYNGTSDYYTATQSTSTVGETSSYVYTAAAFALSAGESAVYEDENTGATYVLYCTNDNDEEARQSAIDSEIESRKDALFSEKYAEITKDAARFTVDEKVLATLNFNTPLYVMPEETTPAELETEGAVETGEEPETEEALETAEAPETEAAEETEAEEAGTKEAAPEEAGSEEADSEEADSAETDAADAEAEGTEVPETEETAGE